MYRNSFSNKNTDTFKKSSKRKSVGGSLDKESRELLKNMESKVEDLRKQAFNEINRLEAMMEKDQQESKN